MAGSTKPLSKASTLTAEDSIASSSKCLGEPHEVNLHASSEFFKAAEQLTRLTFLAINREITQGRRSLRPPDSPNLVP